MKIYINGSSSVSACHTFSPPFDLSEPEVHENDRFECVEPDYDKILEPTQIRRLSRILKMSLATASSAIKDADNPKIDSIITGTGFGCLEDTLRFLLKMVDPDDRGMNPTSFIQSTYNTVSSLIALSLKNNGYNNTFVHSGFSFESALDDAIMLLRNHESENVLVGGIDELTQEVYGLLKQIRLARSKATNKEFSQSPSDRYRFGEGSSFFVLSDKPGPSCRVVITDFKILYKPEKDEVISIFREFSEFYENFLFLTGDNDGLTNDESYSFIPSLVNQERCYSYKRLCGDYPTASSFGLWLAASVLSGTAKIDIPSAKTDRILLFNSSEKNYYSFLSLKKI